jgi:hypothetical protein
MSELQLEQTYLLCVDPIEKKAFGINMGTGRIVEDAEDLSSGGSPPISGIASSGECTTAIRSKIERQAFIMKDLLDEVGEKDPKRVSKWAIRNSQFSESFRRSMVQLYHLE